MRNDAITFHFENEADGEVQLRPQSIVNVSNALEALFTLLIQQAGVTRDDFTVQVNLVAIKPGSIDVSFVAEIAGRIFTEIETTPVSAFADALSIAKDLGSLAVLLYVASGYAKPRRPDSKLSIKEPALERFRDEALSDPQVRQQLLFSVSHALQAGADIVTIRILDEPELIVSENGASNPKLIGSAARPSSRLGPFEGEIVVGSDEVQFILEGDVDYPSQTYRNGNMLVDGEQVPILIAWRSQRPIPYPIDGTVFSHPVRVEGIVTPITDLTAPNYKSYVQPRYMNNREIPVSMHKATAILTVSAQIFKE